MIEKWEEENENIKDYLKDNPILLILTVISAIALGFVYFIKFIFKRK